MGPTSRRSKAVWILVLLSVALTSSASAQQQQIQSIVSAGRLDGMRWPNFSDYRVWLQKFYEPAGYAPAWSQSNTPSAQASAMIQLFHDAWRKGLEPEDYDASRWDARIRQLQSGAAGAADFDVALSVCAMRYISDLRIGRINPRHFQFGLSIEEKKYDLADFVRARLLTASDVPALAASVEPPFPTYQRTE